MRVFVLATVAIFGLVRFCAAAEPDYLEQVKPILVSHCYECHGVHQQKGELRLDTAAFALAGGESGPGYIPGDGANSLLVQSLQGTHPGVTRMPFRRDPLSSSEIALIAQWIEAGAPAPENETPQELDGPVSTHWSFQPVQRPQLPEVKAVSWPRNPIDHFILARLEKEGISPAPQADKVTLIRRVSLDLTGLPPSLEELEEFLYDHRPDAYERLVDRLLASPHYGERWGRHWLDAARYADSHGYSIDAPRSIWPYRDWVINALNADMPFDQFTIEQLAGDLLPEATLQQKIATGFHRNTQINQEGGIDPEQFRIESIFDRVDATSTIFLGLTMSCAQCHDHKYDPISQMEYYRFFAFLNNDDEPVLEIADPEELDARDQLRKELRTLEAGLKEYAGALKNKQSDWEAGLSAEERSSLKEIAALLEIPAEERGERQKRRVFDYFLNLDPAYQERQLAISELQKKIPRFDTSLVLQGRQEPRETHFFIQGDFTRPREKVSPGVPRVLHPLPETENSTRLDLANWLVHPDNPLTARVAINRVWQQYFGRGLVETENDFGAQAAPPTHPGLLDWLASEFQRQNWSLKSMHRLIVTSATYKQSSRARPELDMSDPYNHWLARQNRLRLEAEVIRDVGLAASGLLVPVIGGPSVFPPQPDGVMNLGQVRREWKPSTGPDRYRRGLYTFFWRATPHPALKVFDAPDAFSACTKRLRSNTPLQALTLLNDQAFFEMAQGLAARILSEGPSTLPGRLDYAFRLCLARSPAPSEQAFLASFFQEHLQEFQGAPEEAESLISRKTPAATDPAEWAAWTLVARVLLNLDETITRE